MTGAVPAGENGQNASQQESESALAALLAEGGRLKAKRHQANDLMAAFGAAPAHRLLALGSATTETELDRLINRINNIEGTAA